MRFSSFILLSSVVFFSACEDQLGNLKRRQAETKSKLEALGEAVFGQTAPELGFLFTDKVGQLAETPWVQVDLGESAKIDRIALLPVQADWDPSNPSNRLFPKRFRVQISDDPAFLTSLTVVDFTQSDFPDPKLTPVSWSVSDISGRYVRLSVVAPSIFALAEIMVISGNRNIALGCKVVSSSESPSIKNRWAPEYLVDGRTPLGPPIIRQEQKYPGLFTGPTPDRSPVWMMLNLGKPYEIQEVRLHPIHNRQRVDMPGYGFPAKFRVECALEAAFQNPKVLFDASQVDFPVPGTNVVTVSGGNAHAQYVRVILIAGGGYIDYYRFGLSEMEVYSGGQNVARQAEVNTVGDPAKRSADWPKSLLVDGYTSGGEIIEIPEWLDRWNLRKSLEVELKELDVKLAVATAQKIKMTRWITAGSLLLIILVTLGVVLHARRVRRRDLEGFRRRLTQDLHDEVGSNLAAIAMISETAAKLPVVPGVDCWLKVHRISRETTDAMREILWLTGGRLEMRADLMEHLRLASSRMLPGRNVVWASQVEKFPDCWPAEECRQVFLFFKEALANVVRHSQADTVTFSITLENDEFQLTIKDNGTGFAPANVRAGMGLESLRDRAAKLRGRCKIDTQPGKGTSVTLNLKIRH